MKKSTRVWNYIDMLLQILLITGFVIATFYICLNLEKYFYRYTLFPAIALISIFVMGTIFGRSLERTRKYKPVGLLSKYMTRVRKEQNSFIFKDDEETYVPKKRMIEEVKSGNISHIKQYKDQEVYKEEDFEDIYNINIEDMIDKKLSNDDILDSNDDKKENN